MKVAIINLFIHKKEPFTFRKISIRLFFAITLLVIACLVIDHIKGFKGYSLYTPLLALPIA